MEYDVILRIKRKMEDLTNMKTKLETEIKSAFDKKIDLENKLKQLKNGSKEKFDHIKKIETELSNVDDILNNSENAIGEMIQTSLKFEKAIDDKLKLFK